MKCGCDVQENKPDRFDYVKYDEDSAACSAAFKIGFQSLATAIEMMGVGRSQFQALVKLEESYMWVGKAIRDLQLTRGRAPLQEERKDG